MTLIQWLRPRLPGADTQVSGITTGQLFTELCRTFRLDHRAAAALLGVAYGRRWIVCDPALARPLAGWEIPVDD